MAKVKVVDLARELSDGSKEIKSKDIINYLHEKNVEVKAANSSIEDEKVISMIKKKFGKKPTATKQVAEKPKAEKAAKIVSEKHVAEKHVAEKSEKSAKPVAEKLAGTAKAAEAGHMESRSEVKLEEKSETKAEEAQPKKKHSIKAVFNPQYSKSGVAAPRPKPKRPAPKPIQAAEIKLDAKVEDVKKPLTEVVKPVKPEVVEQKAVLESKAAEPKAVEPKVVPEKKPEPQIGPKILGSVIKPPGEKTERPRRPAGSENRPVRRDSEGRPIRREGDRPVRRDSEGRPIRREGDRPQGQGRPYGDRPQGQGGQNRPYGDRPQGQGRPYGDRPQGQGQGRPYGDRTGGQGQGRPYGDRTGGQGQGRPYGDRPQGQGQGRPYGDRPQGQGQGRPYGNRPGGQGGQGGYRQGGPGGQGGYRPGGQGGPGGYRGRPDQDNRTSSQGTGGDAPRNKESREHRRGVGGQKPAQHQRQGQGRDQGGKKQERFMNLEKNAYKKKKPGQPAPAPVVKEEVIKTIVLPERLTIKELADKMKMPASAIVKKLFLQGTMVTVNQEVDYDQAEEIAVEFNFLTEQEIKVDVIEELLKEDDEDEGKLVKRPPVVVVMGHVDHGKTSLLDAIRDSNVTDRESGGITQHIGAYMVTHNGEKITFLDTPGHEAFTSMRLRGAHATDIAILVVAADDGVMPQTVEAISHAKAAGVEVIVAINKIDKPGANIDKVKQELSEHELIPEDWGGSTVVVPVSAKTREGIDQLLEMILLTAEVSELKANPKRLARGLVIEAQLDKGRGAVATILVQKGTLHVGDNIAAGSSSGKVRAMLDDKGKHVKVAGPSTPVEILGLHSVPHAGEVFVATETDKEAKAFADTFISHGREKLLEDTQKRMSLDDLFTQIKTGNIKELPIIVKADVQGSVEAVRHSLVKLSGDEVAVKIVHSGVGAINESDVNLAQASNAIIIGFHVKPDAQAKATAEREGVEIKLYSVIYKAIEDIEAAMKGMLDPIFEEKVLGHAEVRMIFKSSDIGNIAGSYVLDGIFQRGCKVRITREGNQIFEGNLASLKRFKDDVKEVRSGYECGLVFDGFSDIQELDLVEAYTMVEVPR